MPTRRDLLKSVAATLTAWLIPSRIFATTTRPHFYFLQTETLKSWLVTDPVAWALKNQHEPVLERAAEGVAKLTADDGDRIIRLVVRRCRLNLLEVHPEQVVVHHWSSQRADLRPFFMQHGLARPQVEVVLRERKKEVATTQHSNDSMFGDRLADDFPFELIQSKWASRFEQEPDDWQTATGTGSGYAWKGIEDDRIPWAALKSAWRQASPLICLNCNTPTILTNFGNPWNGLFNRAPRLLHVCGTCRRSFRNEAVKDAGQWIVANLDAQIWPRYGPGQRRRAGQSRVPRRTAQSMKFIP